MERNTATYTDHHELLADPDIDVVSVVTMWDQHAEPAVAAIEAGKHVNAVHDTDPMLWYTGAAVKTAYAQTHRVRESNIPISVGLCTGLTAVSSESARRFDTYQTKDPVPDR